MYVCVKLVYQTDTNIKNLHIHKFQQIFNEFHTMKTNRIITTVGSYEEYR
jgi:hypothetical protein